MEEVKNLLLEITTEEIPFLEHERMYSTISKFFQNEPLIICKNVECYSTPSRLIIHIVSLQDKVKIPQKQIKGPPVNANIMAIEGFLKKYSCKMQELQQIDNNYYLIKPEEEISIKNILEDTLLSSLFEKISLGFSKTMVWNSSMNKWIRPIKNILAKFGKDKIKFSYANITSEGSTIINNTRLNIANFEELKKIYASNNIILDAKERINFIKNELQKIEESENITCISSTKLIEENAFLSDSINICFDKFDERYLSLPEKVLILSLEKNQKYFLFKNKNGKLSNTFAICINGVYSKDSLKHIVDGNKKVLNARLEDAIFYIKIDSKKPLASYNEMLKKLQFHQNAGSVFERITKMKAIAEDINPSCKEELLKAIDVCKADLCTEMTQSFTELQGYIGAFYAKKEGYSKAIYNAIEAQYATSGFEEMNDVSLYLAFIEKYEKIISLLESGEVPTSSRDPFGIRKDALTIVKILISGRLNLTLNFNPKVLQIILERFEFYLSQQGLKLYLKEGSKICLADSLKLSLFMKENEPSFAEYERVQNILRSKEAKSYLGFEINGEVSDFENGLIKAFNTVSSAKDLSLASFLVADFFKNHLVIDTQNENTTKNRIAILQIIEKSFNIYKYIL